MTQNNHRGSGRAYADICGDILYAYDCAVQLLNQKDAGQPLPPMPDGLQAAIEADQGSIAIAILADLQQTAHTATIAPSSPPPAPTTTSAGGGIPTPLLALAVIGAIAWGLDWVAKDGAQRRSERSRTLALAGGYMGQGAIASTPEPAAEPAPENLGTTQVLPGSGSDSAPKGSDGFALGTPQVNGRPIAEPNPWAMSEADRYSYESDRTGSTLTTGDCWAVLKDCTFVEFQARIGGGNIDPVAVLKGQGAPAAREACYKWFSHGINQQNKICWAVFGTDGKGAGSTARAAVQLLKEYSAEYHQPSRY